MLTTLAFIFFVIWFFGMIGVFTLGWFAHVLLVIAIVTFLFRVLEGSDPIA